MENPITEEDPIFEEELVKLGNSFVGTGSNLSSRRILKEYSIIMKTTEESGLSIEFENENNIYVWKVVMNVNKFQTSSGLLNDFEVYSHRYNKPKEILFEVRFNSNYPISPPFIRVIRPRFQFHTAHVTIGGSICVQTLTSSGWVKDRSLESVFQEILCNITEGGGRIDIPNSKFEYQLYEAQEAFTRVARYHGWL